MDLENLDGDVDINRPCKSITENIKISAKVSPDYYKLKKHKPWINKGCSKLLAQRKQEKLQWLQDLSQINGDKPNNVRHEASRHFRNKKREHLREKINELAVFETYIEE
jgi:alpha/beta superfamily hydrolase